MIIVPGPASAELGRRIAAALGWEAHPAEHRVFPDGENYLRLTAPLRGEVAVIVQTTAPPQDTRLMQLLLMAGTAKALGAERVICVVPYLAYARQDKRFLEGEALSLEVVVRLLGCAGADDLLVVDPHSLDSLARLRSGPRVESLSAIPLLAGYLRGLGYGGALSLGPDRGAIRLAEAAAGVLGGGSGFFEKRRDRRTGEIEMEARGVEVAGRDAVVFDDIVSSGGTMATAVAWLRRLGARRVAAACTHALLMGDAERRIMDAGAELIVATDTVETPFSRVSVAGLIAEHLKGLIT